jgi:hypothetical protein
MAQGLGSGLAPFYLYKAKPMPREKQARMDGDTYWMDIDLGLRVHAQVKIRLRDYSAPELNEPKGPETKIIAHDMLYMAKDVLVKTYPDSPTHDRWEGEIFLDGRSMGPWLFELGFVKKGGMKR